jgi:hypothetical protein
MKYIYKPKHSRNQGYVLPMTIGIGLGLIILGLTAAMVVQTDRMIAYHRQQAGVSLAVAEGAADRIMVQLTSRNNAILLGRNYDPINPNTGRVYLGVDSQPNSGDETATATDEWTGYDPSNTLCFQQAGVGAPNFSLSGNMGTSSYRLLAYRFNPVEQVATVLIEGQYRQQVTTLAMTLKVAPDLQGFPSIVGLQSNSDITVPVGAIALRNRQVSGNANIYFNHYAAADSALTGVAEPGTVNRTGFLNTIWASSTLDGAGSADPVSGRIATCHLSPWPDYPPTPSGTGIIDSSTTLTGASGQTRRYWVDKINLAGTETLTVDTTAGPVEIIIKGDPTTWSTIDYSTFALDDDAKILNVRTDGKLPIVGDLRIIVQGHSPLSMRGRSCIQNVFLWMPVDEFWLMTSGSGCPSGRNTNFEGVVWAEALLSSKNNAANRDVNYLGTWTRPYDTTVTPGATSGIYVPDDLNSLNDLLLKTGWPARYRVRGILNWQQVRV